MNWPNSSLTSSKFGQAFIRQFAHEDNWHNLNLQTGDIGYGWIHYSLIRILRPKRVLCVGSRYGFIPAICALGCKDNQQGVVDFVDAGFDQNKHDQNHWGGVGLWNRVDKETYFKPFGLAPYINLHVMTSQKFAHKYPHRSFQYIHLDGDHSYRGIKSDFNLFWPRLSPGQFLCLHDIFTKNLGGLDYGVSMFWQELKKNEARCTEYDGKCGLGVIQK